MTERLSAEQYAEALELARSEADFAGFISGPERMQTLFARALLQADQDARRYKQLASVRHIELRRLNKYLGPYWAGFRRGLDMEATVKLRGSMNAAFGHEKVRAAEHAAIDRELAEYIRALAAGKEK